MSQINSKFPFDSLKEDRVFTNGEASSTIAAGKLFYKVAANDDTAKLTADGKPIGVVGIALQTAVAGARFKGRVLGYVTAGDLSTGVLDTNATTTAGDTLASAAAGAMATWATAAERRIGYCIVKSATVGEMFINGFQG